MDSFDPASGALLGTVPETGPAEVRDLARRAAAVQPYWAALPLADRARYMGRIAQVVVTDIDPLAELISREQGRPRTEALLMELLPSVDALRWLTREGPRRLRDRRLRTRQAPLRGKRSWQTHDPRGVVAVLAPWSSPWASPLRRVALALMAGNGVLLHAPTLTPLIAERLAVTLERAGVPEGLVGLTAGPAAGQVLGERRDRDEDLVQHAIRFSGGRHDPMLVREDASLSHAVAGAGWAAFSNAGQSRANVARVYVHETLAEPFVERLATRAGRLRVGDPRRWETEVGPLTDPAHADEVLGAVEAAERAGATRVCGGAVDVEGRSGRWLSPIVMTGVRPEMRVAQGDLPGPVLPVFSVSSDEEALSLADAYGPSVGASVWTGDPATGGQLVRELRAERTWINDHMLNALAPAGFSDVTNPRLRVWESSRWRDLWWHPYDASLAETARAAARYLYGRERDRTGAIREGARPAARLARRLARDTLGRT